jgi:hypothetical protein
MIKLVILKDQFNIVIAYYIMTNQNNHLHKHKKKGLPIKRDMFKCILEIIMSGINLTLTLLKLQLIRKEKFIKKAHKNKK